MPRFEELLDPQDWTLWTLNQTQEIRGLKKDAKKSLASFITNLQSYEENQLDSIVLSLCQQREEAHLKIRHPLFEKVIYPNLVKNALNGRLDYYRLLATFEQYFHSSNQLSIHAAENLNLKEKYIDAIDLLNLELNGHKNRKAAILLINKIGWHLDYALHELPTGLLYELTVIEEFCMRIKQLVSEYKIEQEKWDQRLTYVRTILTEWQQFRLKQSNQDFFEHLKTQQTKNATLILEWNKALYDYQEI